MDEVEIQAFTADTPASKGITAAHIAQAAESYSPNSRAPIVMGHPSPETQDSAPAFGEISGARVDGSKLFVKIKNLGQEIVDGVKSSKILNRSLAFWHPNHPSNPTPGKLSIRHLGFLGSMSPGIPNLPALQFTADDQLEATADEAPCMIFAAPTTMDGDNIKAIAEAVAAILKPTPEVLVGKEFAVDEAAIKAAQATLEANQKAFEDQQKEFAKQQLEFAASQKAWADQAKAAREASNTQFAAGLVQAGKFPAGSQADLVTVLNSLPTEVLDFSDNKKEAPADALKRILTATKVQFTPNQQLSPNGNPEFAADDDAEAKALAAVAARDAAAWNTKAA